MPRRWCESESGAALVYPCFCTRRRKSPSEIALRAGEAQHGPVLRRSGGRAGLGQSIPAPAARLSRGTKAWRAIAAGASYAFAAWMWPVRRRWWDR